MPWLNIKELRTGMRLLRSGFRIIAISSSDEGRVRMQWRREGVEDCIVFTCDGSFEVDDNDPVTALLLGRLEER